MLTIFILLYNHSPELFILQNWNSIIVKLQFLIPLPPNPGNNLYTFYFYEFDYSAVPQIFPGGASGNSACQCRGYKRRGFHPWVRKIPWMRVWQPTPVFLPGESHGQRNLGEEVHGVEKSWTRLKWLSTHAHTV